MKRYENVKMVLFDSSNAYFKLAVEAQFTRKSPDGSYRDLVYTTDKGTSILNPNIYLTLAYKDDNMNAVYTSYPQLYRIRQALETIKNQLENPDAFILDPNDNSMSVKQTYADSVIVDNIGKNNNWIALKLCVIKTGENGVYNYTKGVTLELSTSNGWASQLTQEEFLTIYTIIKDLNLTNLQCMLSLGFLNGDARVATYGGYNGGYSQPNANYYAPSYPQNNQPNYTQPAPMATSNWNNTPQAQGQQTNYMRPRYNNNTQRTPSYRTPAPVNAPQQQVVVNPAPAAPQQSYSSPVPTGTGSNLPPRSQNKPLMNMNAIEETPVSSYDIDDTEALNSIFGDN